jgi:hypothetical protein
VNTPPTPIVGQSLGALRELPDQRILAAAAAHNQHFQHRHNILESGGLIASIKLKVNELGVARDERLSFGGAGTPAGRAVSACSGAARPADEPAAAAACRWLGKTIQAGLILTELIARRILVVAPAGPLLEQWQAEMLERFGLRLETVDRARLEQVRRSEELGANPFDRLSQAIASPEFLKQEYVLLHWSAFLKRALIMSSRNPSCGRLSLCTVVKLVTIGCTHDSQTTKKFHVISQRSGSQTVPEKFPIRTQTCTNPQWQN